MADISTLDSNLKIAETFGRDDIILHDVLNAPFSIRRIAVAPSSVSGYSKI